MCEKTSRARMVGGKTRWFEWLIAIPLYVLFVPYLIYLRFTTKGALDKEKWEAYSVHLAEQRLKYILPSRNILDIGSYKGHLVKILRDNGVNAVGIDLNQSNEFVIKGDAKKLPFGDCTFDYVVISHLIEHLDFSRLKDVIREAHRVLEYGGKMLIATPLPKDVWDDCSHVRPYTFHAIKQMLEQPDYIGEEWGFKVTASTERTRANPLARGVFYRLSLFSLFKRVISPILSWLGIGTRELMVVAKKELKTKKETKP
jgi:SAM-dependent methyltransferase